MDYKYEKYGKRFNDANEEELRRNGYVVLRGNELKEFKLRFGSDINVATKTTVLGIFDFRSWQRAASGREKENRR